MNDCGHYQQFFQGKPLPCAECSKMAVHRVIDRESGAGPVSFRPQTTALPTTRPQLDIVLFERRKVRVETSVWVTESERSDQLARHALRHQLGEPTRDELELRQVLGDAALESAMVQSFGERLRARLSGRGIQCKCGLTNGLHTAECEIAALLRDMLGPEETQRQVDAAHEESFWFENIFRREYLGRFPTGQTATEILLRQEELLSQAGFVYSRDVEAGEGLVTADLRPTHHQHPLSRDHRGYFVGAGAHFPSDEQEQPD